VQRLQIELLIGLGWNKARRPSLHGLGHSMSISKVILISLPKRLRIGDLLHVVAKRCKLPRRRDRFPLFKSNLQTSAGVSYY
jgi:hypothetical protein